MGFSSLFILSPNSRIGVSWAELSSESRTHIAGFLLDISTWMSQRQVKFQKLRVQNQNYCSPSSLIKTSQYAAPISVYFLQQKPGTYLLFISHIWSISNLFWLSLQKISEPAPSLHLYATTLIQAIFVSFLEYSGSLQTVLPVSIIGLWQSIFHEHQGNLLKNNWIMSLLWLKSIMASYTHSIKPQVPKELTEPCRMGSQASCIPISYTQHFPVRWASLSCFMLQDLFLACSCCLEYLSPR